MENGVGIINMGLSRFLQGFPESWYFSSSELVFKEDNISGQPGVVSRIVWVAD